MKSGHETSRETHTNEQEHAEKSTGLIKGFSNNVINLEEKRKQMVGEEILDGTRYSLSRNRPSIDGKNEICRVLYYAFLFAADKNKLNTTIEIAKNIKIAVLGTKPIKCKDRDKFLKILSQGKRTQGLPFIHIKLKQIVDKNYDREEVLQCIKRFSSISICETQIENGRESVRTLGFIDSNTPAINNLKPKDQYVEIYVSLQLMALFDEEGYDFDPIIYESLKLKDAKSLYLYARLFSDFRKGKFLFIPRARMISEVGVNANDIKKTPHIAKIVQDLEAAGINMRIVEGGYEITN